MLKKLGAALLAAVVALGSAYAWFDQHSASLCRRLGHIKFLCDDQRSEVAGQPASPDASDPSKVRTQVDQLKESNTAAQDTNTNRARLALPIGKFQILVGQTKLITPGTRIFVQGIGGTGTDLKADLLTDSVQGLTTVRAGDVLPLPSDLGDILVTVVQVVGQSVTFTARQAP